MIYSATVTKTGQITIPKSVREILGVKPGQKIKFKVNKKDVSVEREKSAMEIADEIHALFTDEMRERFKKNACKTAGQVREEWLKSDEARKYYEERLRRTL